MKIFLCYILFLTGTLMAAGGDPNLQPEKKSKYELIAESKSMQINSSAVTEVNPRYVRSIIFSFLIPGAGQTYTGNHLKGTAITITFFGTALGAILNNNNFNGREERIKNLLANYQNAGDFVTADKFWNEIQNEKVNRDNDNNRRKIFTYATIGLWLLNMADIIFYNEDHGPDEFARTNSSKFQIAIESTDSFNGIALKYNLP